MRSSIPGLVRYALVFALTPASFASTWYVNGVSGSDGDDCKSSTSACQTIGHAISLASSGDSIKVAAATYKENLTIALNLSVIGAGVTRTVISGEGIGRVITIPISNVKVQLSQVGLRNGHAAFGAGIYSRGGSLGLDHVTLTGNRATMASAFGDFGGAIYNTANLTINHTTISQNAVSSTKNAGRGGGIANLVGTLTISNSTITGNTASGVSFMGVNRTGGGGIYNTGTLKIINSTVSANVVSSGTGGGVSNLGTLAVSNGTISGNSATSGGGILNVGAMTLQNSIVANSVGGNCSGAMTSNGYNLSDDSTCNLNGPGDLTNIDPQLGTLGNYGGPTQTIPLISGSPAIDAGNPSGCQDSNGNLLKTDQRGKPRPDPEDTGGCDMGAYENQTD